MATQREYWEQPVDIPKRHNTWFAWMLLGFAVLVLVTLVYGFLSIASVPMPKLDVPAQEPPSEWPRPASPTPKPAGPDGR